jgi:serine/threonine protein kinase
MNPELHLCPRFTQENLITPSIESDAMGSTAIREDWEGRTVDGRFALLEWLGGSQMQGVFLTVRQGVEKAAIKLIVASDAEAEAYLAQWEASKELSHPHLMPIYEAGRSTINGVQLVYVVTQIAESDLAEIVAERPLAAFETRDIFAPLLDAISYLHNGGFVHGHVEPSNIFDAGGEWKLSSDDFLIADGVLKPNLNLGKYAAPEIEDGTITGAADIWSLGMTLAETLTQRSPVWSAVANGEPVLPQSLPSAFQDVVQGCLRTDPSLRCSAADIKTLLARAPVFPAPLGPQPVRPSAPRPVGVRAAGGLRSVPTARPLTAVPRPMAPAPRLVPFEARQFETAANPVVAHPDSHFPPHFEEHVPIAEAPFPEVAETAQFATAPDPYPFVEELRRNEAPFDPPPASTLFADFDKEDTERTEFHVLPLLIGLLVLAAFAGVLVARNRGIDLSALWTPRNTATAGVSTPKPQSPGPSPSAAALDEPSSAPQSAAAAPTDTQRATTPSQTSPLSQAPTSSSSDSTAAPREGSSVPSSQPSAAKLPDSPSGAQRTEDAAPLPETAARALNATGAVADRVMPSVSPSARVSMHGPVEVYIRVTVGRSGAVEDAAFVSQGPGNYFARTAQRAAKEWKFNPPLHNGRPEPSVWMLRFYFSRRDTEITSTEESR